MYKPIRTYLFAILLLSILLRVGVALHLGNGIEETRGGTYDQFSYDMLAQRVVSGHGFSFPTDWWPFTKANQPTAHWSYLYTLLLTTIFAGAGHQPIVARILQAAVVGVLMPWLIYRIGRRAFGPQIALIAALVTAVYLYFINYAASLMTESFYIVGILWTVDVSMRMAGAKTSERDGASSKRQYASLGLELGIAMAFTLLLRQVIVIFLPMLVLWLLWVAWRRGWLRQTTGALALAGLVTGLLISPFIVHNYRTFDRLTMPNTNSGFAFFWANHPIYGTRFESVLSPSHQVTYQDLIPVELRELNEAELDRALLRRGLGFVREDPGRYLRLSLSRIPVYFLFWPTSGSTLLGNAARVLSFGLFLPFMIYGLVLALRQARLHPEARSVAGSQPGLYREYVALFLLFIVTYTLVHLLSWANVRYRLPVDAFLILFAAYGIDDLLTRLSSTWRNLKAPEPKPQLLRPPAGQP